MDSDHRCTQLPDLPAPHDQGGGGSRAAPQPPASQTPEQPKPVDLAGRDSGSTAAHAEIKLPEKVKRTRGRKPKASSAKPKGRPKGKLKSGSPTDLQNENRDDEDVCFICFDGGELVLCDRRGCPKAYHPACIKRDRSFFRCKAKWNCGWHICSSCQKKAHYLCYTCTYSLCKSCVKGADYICLRDTNGLCGTCRKTIMLIENIAPANEEKVQVDFDDQLSWEYLFKVYWSDLKEKLSLTADEIIQAKNPKRQRKRKRKESIEQVQNGQVKPRKARCGNEQRPSFSQSTAWASSELLDFVAFMKNGDKSVISRYDVQALLLEYISRNNLHDPRQKWQIFCDGRLAKLFGKANLDQFEMLKLLDSHFHFKENTQVDGFNKWMLGNALPGHIGIDLNNDKDPVATDDQKNENSQCCEERVLTSQDCGTTKDAHNSNLKFVRRNFVESLIDDSKFSEKVIGSVVRIRTSNNDQKQEMYRMAQVIGTSKAEHSYKIGEKTTNIKLEVQNLDKKELVSIDEVSNEDCTKDEWRFFDQMIRCGSVKWLNKDEILQNATMVKSEKVFDGREATGLSSWNSGKNHQHTDAISSLTREAASGNVSEISPSPLSTATEVSVNDDETCKMWQYQDPNGKIQGPFTMSQMRRWRTVGQLPLDVRIWRVDEKREDSILLADALVTNGRHHFTREQGMALLSSSQCGKEGGGVAARGAEDSRGEMSSISVDTDNRTVAVDRSRITHNNILLNNFTCKGGGGGNNLHESSEMGSCFSGSSPVDSESEKKNMEKCESLNSLKEAAPPDERFSQFNVSLNSSLVQKQLLQCDGGDGISSSQSSGQNWKALSPVISSSNDGSSKVKATAPTPSLAEKLQQQQKKSMIDFLDPPPTGSSTRFKAAEGEEELGQSNRVVKLEQWDSTTSTATTTTTTATNTVASSCCTPNPVAELCSNISIDGATLTLGHDPVLPTASSWQAMLLEPVEITSLPDEAVSDLLAELEASEPGPPLNNNSSSKNEGYNLEADFFPILSPTTMRNELPLGFGSSGASPSQRVVTWQEGSSTNPSHFQMGADPMRWGMMMQNMGGWGGGVMSHHLHHHGYRNNMFVEAAAGGGGGGGAHNNNNNNIVGMGQMNYGGGSSNSFSNNNSSRYANAAAAAAAPPTTTSSSSPRDQFFEGLNLDLGRGGSSFWDNLNSNNRQ